jgi:hypothetical protein
MAKHLPVPPELEHLIEKRDAEADRRERKRRKAQSPIEDAATPAKPERRQASDRRRKRRRKADS